MRNRATGIAIGAILHDAPPRLITQRSAERNAIRDDSAAIYNASLWLHCILLRASRCSRIGRALTRRRSRRCIAAMQTDAFCITHNHLVAARPPPTHASTTIHALQQTLSRIHSHATTCARLTRPQRSRNDSPQSAHASTPPQTNKTLTMKLALALLSLIHI